MLLAEMATMALGDKLISQTTYACATTNDSAGRLRYFDVFVMH
jgi:hypothetical protein